MTAEQTLEKIWEIVGELVEIIVDYNLSHMEQTESKNISEEIQHVGYDDAQCGRDK